MLIGATETYRYHRQVFLIGRPPISHPEEISQYSMGRVGCLSPRGLNLLSSPPPFSSPLRLAGEVSFRTLEIATITMSSPKSARSSLVDETAGTSPGQSPAQAAGGAIEVVRTPAPYRFPRSSSMLTITTLA